MPYADAPASPALEPAARAFLRHAGTQAPDFSGCLILLPHQHAGVAFRRALSACLPGRTLLPPSLHTLPGFAATAPLSERAEPDSLRLAQVRDFLAASGHVPVHSLWSAARELLQLIDELDAAAVEPDGLAESRAFGNRYLSVEAGLVFTLWRAFAGTGGKGGPRLHARRLDWLAQRAAAPLYTLGLRDLSGVERDFLRAWAARAPVIALPEAAADAPRRILLDAAWRSDALPLATRAARHAAAQAASPFADGVELVAAPGLEAAAEAAQTILLRRLAEGRREIALIALDRLMARRLRALLERRGILVRDETGWAFATAAVSHVLERWLRLLDDEAGFQEVLDLLKSPFVLAEQAEMRTRAAHELDDALRRQGASFGLAGHLALARRLALPHALPVLERLRLAAEPFNRRAATLHEWTRRLLDALVALGAATALANDPAGAQMLALLRALASDSAAHRTRYSRADWRHWLLQHLEQATFLDAGVLSPIRLSHLAAAHARDFEAAIILGAGAAQLPGTSSATFFNDAVRAQLGLPTCQERAATQRAALAEVLACVPVVSVIWQSEQDGENVPLSPWLLQLDAFHRAAWGSGLPRGAAPRRAAGRAPADTPRMSVAAPRADALPARLSVSAWQSLVACPYQYFARYLLRLNERDEVPEELDKADYGSLVHRILADFHRAHPILAQHAPAALATALRERSDSVFASALARGYLVSAWQRRWERHIAPYLTWALAREQAGYRFESAEVPLARAVPGCAGTRLEGRADRIDRRGEQLALLDYKTQLRQTLRHKLNADAEDVQLTAYAWLAGAAQAGFVTLDDDTVENLDWQVDLPAAAAAEAARLGATLSAIAAGASLPAWGAPETCDRCEMQGLCRRAHRPDARAPG